MFGRHVNECVAWCSAVDAIINLIYVRYFVITAAAAAAADNASAIADAARPPCIDVKIYFVAATFALLVDIVYAMYVCVCVCVCMFFFFFFHFN